MNQNVVVLYEQEVVRLMIFFFSLICFVIKIEFLF